MVGGLVGVRPKVRSNGKSIRKNGRTPIPDPKREFPRESKEVMNWCWDYHRRIIILFLR